jgi:putative ABC transport system permease protein
MDSGMLDGVKGRLKQLRALLPGGRTESELDDEVRFHLQMAEAQHVASGLSPEDARRRALAEFGGVERYKEQVREARWVRLLQDLGADARYAVRALARNPGYTAAAVLTLGLGIGVNTAVFSVMDAVLLRPLPYASPERLVLAGGHAHGEELVSTSPATYAEYVAWRSDSRLLEAVGAYTTATFRVTGGSEPVLADALVIDAGLLPVLGVTPWRGTGFTADMDAAGGASAVLLSYEHWQTNFGGDPAVIGKVIELSGASHEVRGIMPAGFDFPPALRQADGWWSYRPVLYVPLTAIGEEVEYYPFWVVGRLAEGATAEHARSELASIAAAAATSQQPGAAQREIHLVQLREAVVGPLRPALLAFLGAVALVLLIACVNLGALMLARLSARDRELGVRLALGAGRRRIARQLVTESMVLAACGGAAGVVIAALALHALLAAAPADLPTLADASLNFRVVAFCFLATAAAGVLVGLLPAIRASGAATAGLTGGARGAVAERATRRAHGTLVVAEVALAATLLVAAGLLIRSFGVLAGVDPGFSQGRLLTLDVSVPADRYPQRDDVLGYYAEVERRIAALPGVVAAGAVDRLPFGTSSSRVPVRATAGPTAGEEMASTALNLTARAGYFDVMGIPLLQGRGFDDRDAAGAQPTVVVSRALAQRLWPDDEPIGQYVQAFGTRLEVIGVAGDVRHFGPAVAPEPMLYFNQPTDPVVRRSMTLVVRTRDEPAAVAHAVRAEVRAIDALVPVSPARTFAELRSGKIAGERFNALLVGAFGALALLLVAVGIYGVMAFATAQRKREIGVRMALGATAAAVLGQVLGSAVRLVGAGLGIGLIAALPVTRLLGGMLYGIEPIDAGSFIAAAAIMAAVGVLAALLPARRAARVQPLTALHGD